MPDNRLVVARCEVHAAQIAFLTPLDTTEKASIDEAYLDFTQPVRDLILDKNPHLQNVPQGSELGLDTPLPDPPEIDWQGRGNVIPVLTRLEKVKDDEEEGSEAIELRSEEEQAPLPSSSSQYIEKPSDPLNAWSDYALALGAELMQKCRTDVLQQLGYTCSAGVARNKVGPAHDAQRPKLRELI